MTELQPQAQTPVHSITLEACPGEFLKTIETLRHVGLPTTTFELSFKSISHLSLFTRVLNRELDQERVTNELRVTFFHHTRGKLHRQSLVKNQEFTSMKRIRFCSSYHATLFAKYFQHRLKQIQNEYNYIITTGKDGFLMVYLSHEENVSSMFVNEIREMKKKLNFLEVKDEMLCEKFIYSRGLGEQLGKIGVRHEVWYRGKESTIIFYSEKQSLHQMKSLIHTISNSHITIIHLNDPNLPFYTNYLLFSLLKHSFPTKLLESLEPGQLQFNQNKLGIVVHDKHEIFSSQIIEEILMHMKHFVLMTVRGKNARRFYNVLKREHEIGEAIRFCYSKKTVCLCLNLTKLKSLDHLKPLLSHISHAIDHDSIITFNWFHLQHQSLSEYRKHMMQRMIHLLSDFHVENFEKLIQNRALKCSLKLKNANKDAKVFGEDLGEKLVNVVKVWCVKGSEGGEGRLVEMNVVKKSSPEFNQNEQDEGEVSSEGDSSNTSEQTDEEEYHSTQVQQNPQQQQKTTSKTPTSTPSGLPLTTPFTQQLYNSLQQKQPRFHNSQQNDQPQWKQRRPWGRAEELLLEESKIVARIRHLSINETISSRVREIRQKLMVLDAKQLRLRFYNQQSYSLLMHESPFYVDSMHKQVASLNQLKKGDHFVVCVESHQQNTSLLLSYPVCSLQVMRKQQ